MTQLELYERLEIPNEVRLKLIDYGNKRNSKIPNSIINKILQRKEWDGGIKELQEIVVDDSDGIKILWELLHIIENYTYKEYVKREISEDIFVATMRFCTRFLKEHDQNFHTYKFVWAWWFPGYEKVNESLPERTTLQRRMKKHLLDGKRFGIAKGHLRNNE